MFASAKGLRELFSGLRSTSMLAAPWFLLSSFSCLFVRSFVCCFALVGLFVLHCNWNVFYWRFVSNEITISAVLSCSNALSSETSCSSPRRRWVGGWTRELTYLLSRSSLRIRSRFYFSLRTSCNTQNATEIVTIPQRFFNCLPFQAIVTLPLA